MMKRMSNRGGMGGGIPGFGGPAMGGGKKKGKNKKKKLFILPLQGFLFIVCPAFVAYHQSPPLAGQAARYDTLQPECVL